MKKYLQVLKSTWDEITTYRFNFMMWRLRMVLQLLTVYFLWLSVTPKSGELFGYNQTLILTYILGASFIGSIVLSTRTHEIGENINSGDLSNFLSRPINYFGYWFARDVGDKLFNISFSIIELLLLYFILRPPLLLQSDVTVILLTIAAIIIGVVIYFFLGCLMSMIAFWSPDVWGPRFLIFILIGLFSGGAFPLDIFPPGIQTFFQFSPFTYLQYFPLKVYLNTLSLQQVVVGFAIASAWAILLYVLTYVVWYRGLKVYSSQGN